MAQPAIQEPPPPGLEPQRPWYLPRTFDAFGFGPFRWYMGAMIWWNAAMSMQMIVRGYLAFHMTDTFVSLGIVGLGSAIPMLLLSPFGGVIADRTSKRLVLQLGQSFSFVIAVVVATLLFMDLLTFSHLFIASVAQGVMMALVMPSRQALMPEVVGMKRLMNAIPLQTAGMNLMQIIGPAIGGPLIDWVGAGSVYVIMAVMYTISVLMLFGVKTLSPEEVEASRTQAMGASPGRMARGRGGPGGAPRGSAISELKAGLAYVRTDRTVLGILSFAFLGAVLGMPIRMLLPGYVSEVYGDTGTTLGVMQMGMGVGALAGALVLATIRMREHRGLLLAGSSLLMGVAMIGFSTTGVFAIGWIGLLVIGIGSAGRQAMSQILVQEYVEDEYRGRVMSLFMMQFSMMSVGTLVVAIYMDRVGPQFAIGSLGAALIVATLAFLALNSRFRRLN
ncbi:MAG: MFS transporter [Dehalococcoidia bacterium]|nr:MFS transporter [Dehalococcoidia bacterium]